MSRTPIFSLLACLGLGAAVAPGLQAQTLVSPSSEAAVPVEFAPASGFTEEPSWFIAGYGVAGVFDQHRVGTGAMELRLPRVWHGLRGWMGGGASVRGASSTGAGLAYDVDAGEVWRATVVFGPTYYDHGSRGADLGYKLEFLSSFELSAKLPWEHRVSVRLAHLSNSALGPTNPGIEFVTFGYAVPLDSGAVRATSRAAWQRLESMFSLVEHTGSEADNPRRSSLVGLGERFAAHGR